MRPESRHRPRTPSTLGDQSHPEPHIVLTGPRSPTASKHSSPLRSPRSPRAPSHGVPIAIDQDGIGARVHSHHAQLQTAPQEGRTFNTTTAANTMDRFDLRHLPAHLHSRLRTSESHPLTISWILTASMLQDPVPPSPRTAAKTTVSSSTSSGGVFGFFESMFGRTGTATSPTKASDSMEVEENGLQTFTVSVRPESRQEEALVDRLLNRSAPKPRGNLALCSVPGKKVRIQVEVHRYGYLHFSWDDRNLLADFRRIAGHQISMVINLLDDEELAFLGAPWQEYLAAASAHQVRVVRYPIKEGFAPDSDAILAFQLNIVAEIKRCTERGENVLCHCRGGIGRAGLVACCWLLETGICTDARKSIQFLRVRRSTRAIETEEQEKFIHQYEQLVRNQHQLRSGRHSLSFGSSTGNAAVPKSPTRELRNPGSPPPGQSSNKLGRKPSRS